MICENSEHFHTFVCLFVYVAGVSTLSPSFEKKECKLHTCHPKPIRMIDATGSIRYQTM